MAQELTKAGEPRLPFHAGIQARYPDLKISEGGWRVLCDAIFPAAKSAESVLMALDYCKARGLDPFKKPVHIVPVWSSAHGRMVETVWPSIAELRTTAARTGVYAGRDSEIFGPDIERKFSGKVKENGKWTDLSKQVSFPEWCQITVYRLVGGQRCAFVGPRVYWAESYARMSRSEVPNEMWERRPKGQLAKCAEAAALRAAFPEELGNEYAAEEMEGRDLDHIHSIQGEIEASADNRREAASTAAERSGQANSKLDEFAGGKSSESKKATHSRAEAQDAEFSDEPPPADPDDPGAQGPPDEPPPADEPQSQDPADSKKAKEPLAKGEIAFDEKEPNEFRHALREAIFSSQSLDALAGVWKANQAGLLKLPEEDRKALTFDKDMRKRGLEKAAKGGANG